VTAPPLVVTASPHLKAPASTPVIMWTVVATLVPIVGAAFYLFGISSLLVITAAAMALAIPAAWWLGKFVSTQLYGVVPTDPLAIAASEGKLRRNFQGFTDDPAPALLGLGASAISSFPGLLAQTEKNTGRYRMLLSQDHLPVAHGKVRSAEDRYRGAVIERLLCDGRARLGTRLLHENRRALQPFIDRGLADMRDDTLTILPQGLPYSRTIAALFDPYRQDSQRRFSSAV